MKKSLLIPMAIMSLAGGLTGCSQETDDTINNLSNIASLVPVHHHINKSTEHESTQSQCKEWDDASGHHKSCSYVKKSHGGGINVNI